MILSSIVLKRPVGRKRWQSWHRRSNDLFPACLFLNRQPAQYNS